MTAMRPQFRTLKKILHAGHGPVPEFRMDTKAVFDFEVLMPLVDVAHVDDFPDGSECYKSIESTKKHWPDGYGRPLELIFGKKFQLAVLESCVSTMLVDEVSRFDIEASELYAYPATSQRLRNISRADGDKTYTLDGNQHDHHHCALSGPPRTGYEILDQLLEKPRPLRFIVHLLRVLQSDEYQVDNWQLDAGQRLDRIDVCRRQGNDLFAEKRYEEAALKYKEALGIIDNLLLREKPGDPEWLKLDRKNIPLYLNLSQCFLSQSKYYEAAETASEALGRDPHNEKALFRRAKARMGSWDLDSAETDLKLLLEKHPQSKKLINEQLKILEQKRKTKDDSDRVAYKAMIGGLSG